MKVYILALTAAFFMTGCTHSSTTTLEGTVVSVTAESKACEFGLIQLQPTGGQIAGERMYVRISDMTKDREAKFTALIGKHVRLKVTNRNPMVGCSSSDLEVAEVSQ